MKATHAATLLFALTAGLSVTAPHAAAQVKVGGTVGVVIPLIDPMVRELGGFNGSPVLYPVLEKWHVGGIAFSGRAVFPGKGLFDVEAGLLYSPSLIASRDSFNVVRDLNASLWVASLRFPIVLSNRSNAVLFYIAPGFIYSARTGDAWTDFAGTGGPGGLISAGSRARVTRRSNLYFHIGIEDFLQWGRLSRGGQTFERQFHHLPVFSVGLLYQLGGRN